MGVRYEITNMADDSLYQYLKGDDNSKKEMYEAIVAMIKAEEEIAKAKALKEKLEEETEAENTAWSNVMIEAIDSGVVDASEITEEIFKMRRNGMSIGAARRMVKSIISHERSKLAELKKLEPKPEGYGLWS